MDLKNLVIRLEQLEIEARNNALSSDHVRCYGCLRVADDLKMIIKEMEKH